LLTAWAVVTAGALVRAFAVGVLAGPGGTPAAAHRLDLNRASVAELMALPGVGRVRAEAIVLHRVRHGPFHAVADLAAIGGIGPKTAAAIGEHVYLVESRGGG
jgi:competence protein ComEA